VHRDLKDENVVVDEEYNIRLIDLGSVACIPTCPEEYFTKFRGTMDFAAPELIMGKPYRGPESVSHSSVLVSEYKRVMLLQEVWALGVILYAMNFKVNPFKTAGDIVERNLFFPNDADPGEY
jgi:serine/threonine protein kinase